MTKVKDAAQKYLIIPEKKAPGIETQDASKPPEDRPKSSPSIIIPP